MKTALLILFIGVIVTACTAFQYNGIAYSTHEEALRAAQLDVDQGIDGVYPTEERLGGSIVVVIPSRDIIRERGIQNPQMATEPSLQYITDVLVLGFEGVYRVVKQGAIFDEVALVRSPDPENEPFGEAEYKLWLLGLGPSQWQWYLSRSSGTAKVPVSGDMALKGEAKNNSFNKAIISAAAQLQSAMAQEAVPHSGQHLEPINQSGTGFLINKDGFVITNAHIVEGCSRVTISRIGSESLPATLIAIDGQNDLAALKVSIQLSVTAKFRAAPMVRQGEQVTIYGFPLSGALASTGNLSTGIIIALAGLGDDTTQLQISAPVQPGNSGGPVLDEYGLIVGVVRSKLDVIRAAAVTGDIAQNVNFAIKASVVASFLDTNGIRYEATMANNKLLIPDLGDLMKNFSLKINCLAQ